MQVLLAKCARSESQAAFSRACANVRSSSPVSRTKKTDRLLPICFFCSEMGSQNPTERCLQSLFRKEIKKPTALPCACRVGGWFHF